MGEEAAEGNERFGLQSLLHQHLRSCHMEINTAALIGSNNCTNHFCLELCHAAGHANILGAARSVPGDKYYRGGTSNALLNHIAKKGFLEDPMPSFLCTVEHFQLQCNLR